MLFPQDAAWHSTSRFPSRHHCMHDHSHTNMIQLMVYPMKYISILEYIRKPKGNWRKHRLHGTTCTQTLLLLCLWSHTICQPYTLLCPPSSSFLHRHKQKPTQTHIFPNAVGQSYLLLWSRCPDMIFSSLIHADKHTHTHTLEWIYFHVFKVWAVNQRWQVPGSLPSWANVVLIAILPLLESSRASTLGPYGPDVDINDEIVALLRKDPTKRGKPTGVQQK